ncbi:MAG: hypothetical protein BWY65_00899 [Firmicutes bacterium ADurb.Bin373]|nr:MAG: hypothetical protein BWY65_00899 [Firmicutes bacterium ADurb.Bin373]
MDIKNYLQVNDTSLFYSIKGEGEPLVLLHGGFTDLRIWDYQADTFAGRFKTICYDQFQATLAGWVSPIT